MQYYKLRIYNVIADNLKRCKPSKDIILKMIVKIINNATGLNGLVSPFLIFKTYLYISEFDFSTSIITQYTIAIKNVIKKVEKVRAKR